MYHSAVDATENWLLIELDSIYSAYDLQAIRLYNPHSPPGGDSHNYLLRGVNVILLDENQNELDTSIVPITFGNPPNTSGAGPESIRFRYNSGTTTAPSASDADEELIVDYVPGPPEPEPLSYTLTVTNSLDSNGNGQNWAILYLSLIHI